MAVPNPTEDGAGAPNNGRVVVAVPNSIEDVAGAPNNG